MIGFDPLYLLFIVPALLVTLWAQYKIKSTFAEYNKVRTTSGITGASAARTILDAGDLQNVNIIQVSGSLTDYYNPANKTVALSATTFSIPSVSAVGVAAHECGHAVQDSVNYFPLKLRNGIIPLCNIGSALSMPLMFIGMILGSLNLTMIGIILFSLVVLFQLITLPVEFNASRRAIKTLESYNMLTQQELAAVKKVLTAAALTYVAALLTSVVQLLYFFTRANRQFNNRQER